MTTTRRAPQEWRPLAAAQEGMLSRRQLHELGIDRFRVRNQIRAGRWRAHGRLVVSTTTGPLSRDQLMWLGVLHAGPKALVGRLTAAERLGLRNWHRDDITIWIPESLACEPVDGVVLARTRRALAPMGVLRRDLPVCRIEPAVLLFGAYQPSRRTAQGVVAAAVQQDLTTAASLAAWVDRLRPLRWARMFRETLADIAGGSQSVAELDVIRLCRRIGLRRPDRQRKRKDADGRTRWTDCEWTLPNGHVIVLEVDGSFHMDVQHWEDDLARQRRLAQPHRTVVRCTARELRDDPEQVGRDLEALGVPRAA